MATNTSPTQPMHCNANSNNISYSNGTISNGTGLTTSNLVNYYTTAAKSFKLGNTVVCIYNCYNRYFMVDNVQFSFETEGTNVKLRVCKLRNYEFIQFRRSKKLYKDIENVLLKM